MDDRDGGDGERTEEGDEEEASVYLYAETQTTTPTALNCSRLPESAIRDCRRVDIIERSDRPRAQYYLSFAQLLSAVSIS